MFLAIFSKRSVIVLYIISQGVILENALSQFSKDAYVSIIIYSFEVQVIDLASHL